MQALPSGKIVDQRPETIALVAGKYSTAKLPRLSVNPESPATLRWGGLSPAQEMPAHEPIFQLLEHGGHLEFGLPRQNPLRRVRLLPAGRPMAERYVACMKKIAAWHDAEEEQRQAKGQGKRQAGGTGPKKPSP